MSAPKGESFGTGTPSFDNGCQYCKVISESIEYFTQIQADARISLLSHSYVLLERDYIPVSLD
jgi:hypothetical protein